MPGDPHFSNNVLLLHMDDTDGSTTFADVMGHSVVWQENFEHTTAVAKFGTSSAHQITPSVYSAVEFANAGSDFDLSPGSWTAEGWIDLTATQTSPIPVMECWFTSGALWRVEVGHQSTSHWVAFRCRDSASAVMAPEFFGEVSGTASSGWHYWAVTFDGSSYRAFFDGALVGTNTTSATVPAENPTSIALSTQQNYFAPLDETRITKGVARYTATFSAPTEAFPDSSAGSDIYPLSLTIEQTISLVQYPLSLAIEQTISPVHYPLALTVEQRIFETYPLSLSVQQSLYTSAAFSAGLWTVKVMLAGVDVSARLTGRIEIDAEASAACVAEFTLIPASGVLNLAGWTNAPVALDYILRDSVGAVLGTFRRFTGIVDVPEWDPVTGLVTFSCTDNLQRVFEGRTRAEIDAAVDGDWSPLVFDANADPWTYAQDRMSTQAADFDFDVYRQPVKTAWASKSTADFEFDQGDILDGSLRITTPSARNLVNALQIVMEYRFERLCQREVGYTFSPPVVRYIDGMPSPAPQQIGQAIQSTGWALEGTPTLGPLPDPGDYVQSTGAAIAYLSDCPRYTSAGSAVFTLAKRWAQTVTETHTLTLRAPVSIAGVGELWGSDHIAISAGELDSRPADWDKTRAETLDVALYSGSPVLGSCGFFEANHQLEITRHVTATPAGMGTFTATGDRYKDLDDRVEDGRTAFDGAFQTAVARGKTQILAAHRSGRVEAEILLNPLLYRTHTVRVSAVFGGQTVTAKGKAIRVRDIIDIDAGSAVTRFEIAISQPLGVGLVTPTPLDPPDKPTMIQEPESFDPVTAGNLPSYYLAAGDAEMNDSQQGWSPQLGEFRILTPPVDAANIDHATVDAAYSFDIDIPTDEFNLEVS